jgi:FOG: Transposase and inactivated derivatives
MSVKPIPSKEIEKSLNQLFSPEWITETAKKVGFVVRDRKIDSVIFFWTLVLGFGVSMQQTLAKLRRAYETASASSIVPSAFHDRFTSSLVDLLKEAVTHALSQQVAEPTRALSEKLKGFSDLIAADGTILRLHEKLAAHWPACRTNHTKAAIKMHMVASALVAGPRHVALYSERTPEVKTLKIDDWVKDKILLIDLGFFKYNLFSQIKSHGGYFVSRLKENTNPLIVSSLRQWRGNSIDLAGKRLRFLLESLKRQVIDAEVEVAFRVPNTKGKTSLKTEVYRLVGIMNKETQEYHLYLTNIPPDKISAEDIALMYRARWSIELLFKELKSTYALNQISSAKPEVVETLIMTAILTLIVSRRVLSVLQKAYPKHVSRMTTLRWSNVFAAGAYRTLEKVLVEAGRDPDAFGLLEFYLAEVIDPNAKRERLIDPWTTHEPF